MERRIVGVRVVTAPCFLDKRGSFIKVFNRDVFHGLEVNIHVEEIFYSRSARGVIRGFHLQVPPFDLEKLVWVTQGCVLDVLLDLRKDSQTFGQCFCEQVSDENRKVVYIPSGVAHAFCVLSQQSTVSYATSRVYSPEHDAGIRWDSVGFEWPVKDPIISERDQNLPTFHEFVSPF